MKPVFAVDVGGVLASQQHDGLPAEGVVAALEQLQHHYEFHVVSQCGKTRALDTEDWLHQHGLTKYFETQNYIGFNHHDKNGVLIRLGATVFVDDRWKHIGPAMGIQGMTCFHFNERPVLDVVGPQYVHTRNWSEVLSAGLYLSAQKPLDK